MQRIQLSSRDRKDIEKFTKYLVYKYVQIVVQSRQGQRIVTRSKQLSSSDWFNLVIVDQPEILDAVKAIYAKRPVNLKDMLCVEISLQTTEKETMLLEYWYLKTTDKLSEPDNSFQAAMAVYNDISVLLKSLITVTRLTPAYQLCRQQSVDTYSIRYDIRLMNPASCKSSDNYFCQQVVGVVPSPLGAIVATIVYRTQLSISPQCLTPDLSSTIKDDYFNPPPCHSQPGARHVRVAAAGNVATSSLTHTAAPLDCSDSVWSRHKKPAFGPALPQPMDKVSGGGGIDAEILDNSEDTDLPFALLLHHAQTAPPLAPLPVAIGDELHLDDSSSSTTPTDTKQQCVVTSVDSHGALAVKDDFVMVELKAPFARDDDELGRFYRDCQAAPVLSMFEQTCSFQQMLGSINEQLAHFEASANDFNEFVNSLQEME